MAMNTGQFLILCEPHLSKVWHDEGSPRPLQYSTYFNVGSMDELYVEEAKMAGFGQLVLIDEGGNVTYDEAIAPVRKRWDYVRYGLGYKITDKLWQNDRYGEVKKMEMDLRRSTDDTIETFAFAVLNNATGTTIATGFDGLALASASHTRMDGGATQSNYPNAALSYTAVQDMIVSARKLKNDRGRPFRHDLKRVGIVADLLHTAEEIFGGAPNRLAPGVTDTGTPNTVLRFGINYDVVDYLTGTTAWFAQADRHDLKFTWRNKPTTKSEVEFDNDIIKRKVTFDAARGFGEWRGFWLGKA